MPLYFLLCLKNGNYKLKKMSKKFDFVLQYGYEINLKKVFEGDEYGES